jgi:hypothetical protein
VKPSKHQRRLRTAGEFYVAAEHPAGIDWPTLHTRVKLVAAINRTKEIKASLDKALRMQASPSDPMLLDAIDAWQRSYGITDWMLELGITNHNWGGRAGELWAIRAEDRRASAWEGADARQGDDISRLDASLYTEDFELCVSGCDLTQVRFEVWAAEIRSLVDQQLSDIKKASEEQAKKRQMRALSKRPSAREERYYGWTVKFQLLGETAFHISEEAGVSKFTVSEAIRAVARAARMETRSGGKRGRPKLTVSPTVVRRGGKKK